MGEEGGDRDDHTVLKEWESKRGRGNYCLR